MGYSYQVFSNRVLSENSDVSKRRKDEINSNQNTTRGTRDCSNVQDYFMSYLRYLCLFTYSGV
jgi:hypothetical protein